MIDYRKKNIFNQIKISTICFFSILFIYIFALFSPDRFKKTINYMDNYKVTNEVIFILLIFSFLFFLVKKKEIIIVNSKFFWINFYLLIFVILVGGFKIDTSYQFIYAATIFLVPFLLFPLMSLLNVECISKIIKIIIVVCILYSVIAIILSFNYAYFLNLSGNDGSIYQHYSHYRASMMLGSSITVSYYLNLTLPICFYTYFLSESRIWKYASALAIIFNLIATLVLLSRLAAICAMAIIVLCLFFVQKKKHKFKRKIGALLLILLTGIYSYKNFDLSRILNGLDFSASSEMARLGASKLALYIFSENPYIGSGMGRYFERLYTDRWITVDGVSGLIDPHNLYVFVLSEIGLVGFLIISNIFAWMFYRFSKISSKPIRRTAYITLLVFLLTAMGGSQLFNEISFSVIFWVYTGLFYAVSNKSYFSGDLI